MSVRSFQNNFWCSEEKLGLFMQILQMFLFRFRTKPGVLCGLPVTYLLFCKDTFITLAFEGIRTSYLAHIGLLAMAIYGITHCYGNLVTMATEACVCNFAV